MACGMMTKKLSPMSVILTTGLLSRMCMEAAAIGHHLEETRSRQTANLGQNVTLSETIRVMPVISRRKRKGSEAAGQSRRFDRSRTWSAEVYGR